MLTEKQCDGNIIYIKGGKLTRLLFNFASIDRG